MSLIQLLFRDQPTTLGDGRYLVRELLGRGRRSVVYRCTDTRRHLDVAVKLLERGTADSDLERQRLDREARISASLSHPNLVPVLATGEHEGRLFTVSDLVDGPSLRDRVRSEGILDHVQALEWMTEVLQGLAVAHDRGIVHRDIRPANILVDRWDLPRLLDFGLASHPDMPCLTGPGIGVGSLEWSAPEQSRNADSSGPQADVYSAAVTLFWLLTGLPPIDLRDHNRSAPQWTHLHPLLIPILLRATAPDPADRYPDARSFRSALRLVLRVAREDFESRIALAM